MTMITKRMPLVPQTTIRSRFVRRTAAGSAHGSGGAQKEPHRTEANKNSGEFVEVQKKSIRHGARGLTSYDQYDMEVFWDKRSNSR